jgi:ribonuclease HI
MQVIFGITPLHLKAKEMAMATYDRLSINWTTDEYSSENCPSKGHIKQIMKARHNLVGNVETDYTVKTNKPGKVLFNVREAKEDDKAMTEVYTDGSKRDGQVGAAYTITQKGNEITYGLHKLNDECSVYQAELVAIEKAAIRLGELGIKGSINIHTDNQAAIKAMKAGTLISKQAIRTKQALEQLSDRATKLRVFWVKAHVGTRFNERADELAKRATTAGIPGDVNVGRNTLKERYKANTDKEWAKEWAATSAKYKRTRVWFEKLNKAKTNELMKLGRLQLSTCVQWITGFCNLKRHRHKKNQQETDTCRLCEGEAETPEHLSFYCPRLINLRTNCFNIHEGRTKWNVKQLLRFVNKPCIQTLMQDENYPTNI